ncbi:MAG: hypothetical protein V8Q84_10595 [Bilophila sp.]
MVQARTRDAGLPGPRARGFDEHFRTRTTLDAAWRERRLFSVNG